MKNYRQLARQKRLRRAPADGKARPNDLRAFLAVACPDCGVPPWTYCRVTEGWYMLDRHPGRARALKELGG